MHGIACTFGKQIVIEGNTTTGAGRNGIFLYGATDVVIANNICSGNNTRVESGRADIVVGSAPSVSKDVLVTGNCASTILSLSNVSKVVYTNNIINTNLSNNSGAEAIVKNNVIAGVWTP